MANNSDDIKGSALREPELVLRRSDLTRICSKQSKWKRFYVGAMMIIALMIILLIIYFIRHEQTHHAKSTAQTSPPAECVMPRKPQDGSVNATHLTVKSLAVFSCDQGHRFKGKEVTVIIAHCLDTLKWSQHPPACVAVTCRHLRRPRNGEFTADLPKLHGFANFSCNLGYNVKGAKMLECGVDGKWNGTEPECIKAKCGNLARPTNGHVALESIEFLGNAKFSCNKGYKLQGQSNLICQANGTWNGDVPTCLIVTCPDLQKPVNGQMMLKSNQFNEIASFNCKFGYEMKVESNLKCLADGQWNATAPICEPVKCKALKAPGNGRVSQNGTRVNQTAVFSCKTGFKLNGTSRLTCKANGEWNAAKPICVPVKCKQISRPKNGKIESQGKGSGPFLQEITFTCDAGYLMRGANKLTCWANGEWDKGIPTCIAIAAQKASIATTINHQTILNLIMFSLQFLFV